MASAPTQRVGGWVLPSFEIGSLNPLSQANNGEGDQAGQKSNHCHISTSSFHQDVKYLEFMQVRYNHIYMWDINSAVVAPESSAQLRCEQWLRLALECRRTG